MSIYSHNISWKKNGEILYLDNYKDFNFPISEAEYQEYINELKYDSIQEKIDMDEGFGGKLRPVFICLLYSDSTFDKVVEKFVKNQSYWHASIGFGPSLSRTYSFNFGEAGANKFKGGLSFESMKMYQESHPTATAEISCIFLTPKRYRRLKDTLDYYLQNKEKTRYSFINLIYSLFGHSTKNGLKMNLVCSTFVDTILKSVNVNLTGTNKSTNLTKPDDLKADKNEKQFKVFEGNITDYNPDKIANIVEKLSNDVNSEYFSKK